MNPERSPSLPATPAISATAAENGSEGLYRNRPLPPGPRSSLISLLTPLLPVPRANHQRPALGALCQPQPQADFTPAGPHTGSQGQLQDRLGHPQPLLVLKTSLCPTPELSTDGLQAHVCHVTALLDVRPSSAWRAGAHDPGVPGWGLTGTFWKSSLPRHPGENPVRPRWQSSARPTPPSSRQCTCSRPPARVPLPWDSELEAALLGVGRASSCCPISASTGTSKVPSLPGDLG